MFFRRILAAILAVVLSAVTAVVVARAVFLPDTTCVVSRRAVEDLKLEIGYDQVRDALGCDGVLSSRAFWAPELKREIYHWRGDAWPFGRFEGLFYNGVLHGKDVRWITVDVGRTPAAVEPGGANPSEKPYP